MSAIVRTSPAVQEAGTELPCSRRSLDARRDAIRQQMVELNRQRSLAQAKVDELRLQEQQFTQQVSAAYIVSCALKTFAGGGIRGSLNLCATRLPDFKGLAI